MNINSKISASTFCFIVPVWRVRTWRNVHKLSSYKIILRHPKVQSSGVVKPLRFWRVNKGGFALNLLKFLGNKITVARSFQFTNFQYHIEAWHKFPINFQCFNDQFFKLNLLKLLGNKIKQAIVRSFYIKY